MGLRVAAFSSDFFGAFGTQRCTEDDTRVRFSKF